MRTERNEVRTVFCMISTLPLISAPCFIKGKVSDKCSDSLTRRKKDMNRQREKVNEKQTVFQKRRD